jgi:hypothetical protein
MIAEKLETALSADKERFSGVELFYDHGDKKKPNVREPTTYMGRRYGADATLSKLDMVLVRGRDVFLLVEVEESTVRLKKILGDVFGVAVADRIRIKQTPFALRGAVLIVAVVTSTAGKQAVKYKRLERHLARYFKRHPSKSMAQVRIVCCSSTDLVRRIERLIRLKAGKFVSIKKAI